MVWSAVFQTFLCMSLLWAHIGVSVFAGLGVILLSMPLSGFIASRVRSCQKQLMEAKDERVLLTTEVLSAIKVIKLYAWEISFGQRINDLRERELSFLRTYLAYYLFSVGAIDPLVRIQG